MTSSSRSRPQDEEHEQLDHQGDRALAEGQRRLAERLGVAGQPGRVPLHPALDVVPGHEVADPAAAVLCAGDVAGPDPDRLDQLANHEKALTGWLRGDPEFGPIMAGVSRQGSWAHRTIIRPLNGREFDADLLVQMRRQRSWSKDPRRYPEALYEAMLRSPRYRDKVELKTRCVRVTYAGDCHVDLVPYVHVPLYGLYDQQFIVNRRANEFERVNPEGFVDWVRRKDRIAQRASADQLAAAEVLAGLQGNL